MADILEQIKTYKLEEVRKRKIEVPISNLELNASNADERGGNAVPYAVANVAIIND